jgi:hypothetical protein
MLNILSHKGNENQNYSEILFHPSENGEWGTTINAGKDAGDGGAHIIPSYTVGRNVNYCNHYGNQHGGSLKTKNRTTIRSCSSTPGHIYKGMSVSM